MPSFEILARYQAVILTLTLCLGFNPQLDFLAYCGLKDILLVCADWLPIRYPIRISRSGIPVMREKNEWSVVVRMNLGRWRDRSDTGSPYLIIPDAEASDLPGLFVTQSANLIENE